jgi:hypothetical protein
MDLPNLLHIQELITRYGRLLERLGDELGARPLVLPNGDFFPDRFSPDAHSLNRLTERMARHAGMSDIPVRAVIHSEDGGASASSGCQSSACCAFTPASVESAVQDTGDAWTIHVPEPELRHPVAMTTRVARGLAEIFLYETRDETEPLDTPLEVTVDLTATALGFPVLLLEGSYVYSKSCGGPSVVQLTALTCPELAMPFALFVCRGEHSRRAALKELGTTQRALASAALDLLDSNRSLVKALRTHPQSLALGAFELEEATPALLRLFSKKAQGPEPLAPRKSPPAAADPKRDELRALVEEALGSSGQGGE